MICPTTVFGRVGSIVVYPVQYTTGWRLSHVAEEILEAIPAVANADPPPSVILVGFVPFVVASGPHSLPDHVDPSSAGPMLYMHECPGCAKASAMPKKTAIRPVQTLNGYVMDL